MFNKRDVGKQKPKDHLVSLYCDKVGKYVEIKVTELIDGWPAKIIWKKSNCCNCNKECNPKKPNTFPRDCPAFKIEVKKTT